MRRKYRFASREIAEQAVSKLEAEALRNYHAARAYATGSFDAIVTVGKKLAARLIFKTTRGAILGCPVAVIEGNGSSIQIVDCEDWVRETTAAYSVCPPTCEDSHELCNLAYAVRERMAKLWREAA